MYIKIIVCSKHSRVSYTLGMESRGVAVMDSKAMGKKIQTLRKSKTKLTQEKMAEQLGISTNYLSNIERGQDVCSISLLLEIANMVGASIDYLLGDDLVHNRTKSKGGKNRAALLHEVETLSEHECAHLLEYLSFYKNSQK